MIATQLEYRLALPWRLGVVAFGGLGELRQPSTSSDTTTFFPQLAVVFGSSSARSTASIFEQMSLEAGTVTHSAWELGRHSEIQRLLVGGSG